MDYAKAFNGIDDKYCGNITKKIGNPPNLTSHTYICMWSDLLGFGDVFYKNNWSLTQAQKQQVYSRLQAAHSAVLYHSSTDELNLILNDGFAKVYKLNNHTHLSSLGFFLREAIWLHIDINSTEKEIGLPGCRTVLSAGEGIEYLAPEIKYDDYVFNYTKPKGQNISNLALRNGNPTIVYNPKELQMNMAFSKAYTLESCGSSIKLTNNDFYIERSTIDEIDNIAKCFGVESITIETPQYVEYLLPHNKDDLDNVYLGFRFDNPYIEVKIKDWETVVYRVSRFYPPDEKRSEFCFDLTSK